MKMINEAPRVKAHGLLERNTERPQFILALKGKVFWPRMYKFIILLIFLFGILVSLYAQQPQAAAEAPLQPTAQISQSPPEKITVDFVDVDMQDVLRGFSYKTGMNIVAGPEVSGPVKVKLVDVPWEDALDIILKTYDYGYERRGNVIVVAPVNVLTAKKEAEAKLASTIPVQTEVIVLKYIDANDAKKALEPQLSARGKITVVVMRGQKGWTFGTASGGGGGGGSSDGGGSSAAAAGEKRARAGSETDVRSKLLIISDVPDYIRNINRVIAKIDLKPKQVLIDVRIVEVNRDRLRDIGFDWGLGADGAEGAGMNRASISSHILGSQLKPANFLPKATTMAGTYPYTTGFSLIYKKLTNDKFEMIVHALEEDAKANVLSAPRIVTLDNQEASILVGKKYPILKSDVTGTTTTTVTASLDYYQDIGIQLNVVPKISDEKYINMIIHPAVTDFSETLTTYGVGNTTIASYPIIITREAETQIIMEDGETAAIGGLLKDVRSNNRFKVPILADLPFVGRFFMRDTVDTEKIDLLIFITARIVDNGKETEEALKDETKIVFPGGDFPHPDFVDINIERPTP